MRLPALEGTSASRDMLREFGGYHHRLYVPSGMFYDMKNLSSDDYPILSPRKRRGYIRTFSDPHGLFAKEKLCWVNGTDFYYNGAYYGEVEDSEKQFISMGAYILIFPDKKIFNTETMTLSNMEAEFTTAGTVYFTLAKADGTEYGAYLTSDTAPAEPADGQLWVDTSSVPHVLKQFSDYSSAWVPVATTYVKIAATGIGAAFKEYDGVTISGCTNDAFNGSMVLYAVGADYIVVTGILDAAFSQTAALKVERKVPDMDFLTESENRVWGCSSDNHEIYACKLGDPFNWNCFMGISTDSYAVTVGTDGDFTGACTYGGYVLFFKEECIHKVYGSKPGNYQVTNQYVRGVEKGSEKSLIIVNETLYYKAADAVCEYTGGVPSTISGDLGSEHYADAVGGTINGKYYISMKDSSGVWHLFAYDSEKGMWHREDSTQVKCFARCGGELYFIDASTKKLCTVLGSTSLYRGAPDESALESPVEWFAETGDLGIEIPDNKYIANVQIRATVSAGGSLSIYAEYDDSLVWERQYTLTAAKQKSYTVPVIPRRCDHMRLKFAGTGDCRLYSLSKTIEQGSEI